MLLIQGQCAQVGHGFSEKEPCTAGMQLFHLQLTNVCALNFWSGVPQGWYGELGRFMHVYST